MREQKNSRSAGRRSGQRKAVGSQLLDALKAEYMLSSDAELARMLYVGPPILSRIRKARTTISPMLLIRMHEVTEISIKELRALMGDHAPLYRI